MPPRLYGQLAVHIHMATLRRVKLFEVSKVRPSAGANVSGIWRESFPMKKPPLFPYSLAVSE